MSGVVLFAPSPVLTVTVEDQAGRPDVHLHAGGQGVWQARMLVTLGVSVTLCGVLAGESGQVLQRLLELEGLTVRAVSGQGRNGAYVHDRRGGERVEIAEAPADPLTRHELDELYSVTLSTSIDAGAVLLSGPNDNVTVPTDVYRRLAADLSAVGRPVVADLSGERLCAVLAGGLSVLKVSDEEMLDGGWVTESNRHSVIEAMYSLHERGAANVIVTRAGKSALVLADGVIDEVLLPELQAADTHGAGDSLTAGVVATLAAGGSMRDAVRLGAAAGMANVTRHGLGTGGVDTVLNLRQLVDFKRLETEPRHPSSVSPRELAERVRDR